MGKFYCQIKPPFLQFSTQFDFFLIAFDFFPFWLIVLVGWWLLVLMGLIHFCCLVLFWMSLGGLCLFGCRETVQRGSFVEFLSMLDCCKMGFEACWVVDVVLNVVLFLFFRFWFLSFMFYCMGKMVSVSTILNLFSLPFGEFDGLGVSGNGLVGCYRNDLRQFFGCFWKLRNGHGNMFAGAIGLGVLFIYWFNCFTVLVRISALMVLIVLGEFGCCIMSSFGPEKWFGKFFLFIRFYNFLFQCEFLPSLHMFFLHK